MICLNKMYVCRHYSYIKILFISKQYISLQVPENLLVSSRPVHVVLTFKLPYIENLAPKELLSTNHSQKVGIKSSNNRVQLSLLAIQTKEDLVFSFPIEEHERRIP